MKSPLLLFLFFCTCLVACTTGQGDGNVTSDSLFVRDCYRGPFSLDPDFFGASPYGSDMLSIRIQRGDDLLEVSDGLLVTVNDVTQIRRESIGQSLQIGLPSGVSPLGVPPTNQIRRIQTSMALYLHASCNTQNGALYSLCGSITFDSLFSGDPDEDHSEDRLTEASFTAVFGDPRDTSELDWASEYPEVEGCSGDIFAGYSSQRLSVVTGDFSFYFKRGPPAQLFP